MKKKVLAAVLCASMVMTALAGCGKSESGEGKEKSEFSGETLSILTSAGWMDNRYDDTIERFEEEYDVTVDLQTIPADQYSDLLQSKLTTDSCADVFWIQSNPFAIESVIVNPEEYCIDFTGAEWEKIMPETRLSSCKYDDKLYGLQIYHNSPDCVMVYNKTLKRMDGKCRQHTKSSKNCAARYRMKGSRHGICLEQTDGSINCHSSRSEEFMKRQSLDYMKR